MEFTEKSKLMKLATYASSFVALTIIILKLTAWIYTDSLSLLSSLVDSVLDLLASAISLAAVHYSLKPADEDHRFGHGKAEDIAAFAQSAFIAGSALFITIEAINRFFNPTLVAHENIGIVVMLISIVLTMMLLSFQKYVVSKTKSLAIEADSLHYKTDLYVNILVIASFVFIAKTDYYVADSILAFAIAIYIFFGAWKVGKPAFDRLMDKEFSDEERNKIFDIVLQNKEINGMHDLRTRYSGIKPFIQFHLEIDGNKVLEDAHKISDEIMESILKVYPGAEVLIHQDPISVAEVSMIKGRVIRVRQNK